MIRASPIATRTRGLLKTTPRQGYGRITTRLRSSKTSPDCVSEPAGEGSLGRAWNPRRRRTQGADPTAFRSLPNPSSAIVVPAVRPFFHSLASHTYRDRRMEPASVRQRHTVPIDHRSGRDRASQITRYAEI